MNIFRKLFRNSNRSLGKGENGMEQMINEQIEIIKNNGNEVLSTFQKENTHFILYKHVYDEAPTFIFFEIIAITPERIIEDNPTLNAFFKDDGETITLEDIIVEEPLENQGLGSVLLTTLIDIAKEKNIYRITGSLSREDIDHLDKLKYFYKKNNFEVNLYEDNRAVSDIGDIVWNNNQV